MSLPNNNPPTRHHVWVHPLAVLFVCAAALLLGLYFFEAVSTVLLGILAAAIVSNALLPLVRRIPVPRAAAAAIVGLGLIAAVAAIVLALSWPMAGIVEREFHNLPQTRLKVDHLLSDWSARMQLQEPLTVDGLVGAVGQFFAGDSGSRILTKTPNVVMGIGVWLAFIFIGSIFLLADPGELLLVRGLRIAPPELRRRLQETIDVLGPKLRRWVFGTLLSMCIVFTASLVGYSIIGLDLALPLAMLSGMCEIVPTVGPAVAAIVAVLFAATQSGTAVVGVLCVYAIIQAIEAYVILPMIMRGAVQIHPAVTLFSVVLWGKIFGVPGMMLAIPINITLGCAIEYLYVQPRRRRNGEPPELPPPPPVSVLEAEPQEEIVESV
jgi:predicted PurR-regulated permease PerM